MEKKQSETAILLESIKERSNELSLLYSINTNLARVTENQSLSVFLNQHLKKHLNFDNFSLCVTDEFEKKYQVLFYDNSKEFALIKNHQYDVNDGFFDVALQSPEIMKFDFSYCDKNKKTSNFIQYHLKSGTKLVIALSLNYQKDNPTVLFLFFNTPMKFNRASQRILNGITTQMSITVSNIILKNKVERQLAEVKKLNSKDEIQQSSSFKTFDTIPKSDEIIGKSVQIDNVNTLIQQVASSASTVLILGESGTGKELVASAIHKFSSQKKMAMIKVNCAAIPENLIESELFGHEKGSFTEASEQRIGKFELAHNGTLFLDEIGDLPIQMQTKLLRVLQEREIERIGGKQSIKVNVRIIAATNRDLQKEMQEGRFRKDLFYRLNVFPILIPPLRNRKEDIPELCSHFLIKHTNKKNISLSANALQSLMNYSWPGNIRELEHCIERSILLSDGSTIKKVSLSENEKYSASDNTIGFHIKSLKEIEKEYIVKIIKICNGRVSGPNGAAIKLKLPSTTLISKMQKLGIKKEHFSA